MKIFIQVLDNGYTLSTTMQEFTEMGAVFQEVKRRYAFETTQGLYSKLHELIPDPEADV